jgi:hypothetical protein
MPTLESLASEPTQGRHDAYCECGEPLTLDADCETCHEFRCAGCFRVVPWDFGAADEWFAFCDACACKRAAKADAQAARVAIVEPLALVHVPHVVEPPKWWRNPPPAHLEPACGRALRVGHLYSRNVALVTCPACVALLDAMRERMGIG